MKLLVDQLGEYNLGIRFNILLTFGYLPRWDTACGQCVQFANAISGQCRASWMVPSVEAIICCAWHMMCVKKYPWTGRVKWSARSGEWEMFHRQSKSWFPFGVFKNTLGDWFVNKPWFALNFHQTVHIMIWHIKTLKISDPKFVQAGIVLQSW